MKSLRSVVSVVSRCLLLSCLTGAAFQAVPNLVVYYKYEETGGPTAFDSSGNGLNGTWAGLTNLISASAVADCSPNTPGNTRSVKFAVPATLRTAGGYISTPNTAATRFTGPFTMMCWIKPLPLLAGQNHVDMSGIIFNADYLAATGWNGYTMHRNMAGQIRFVVGSATASATLTSTGTAPDNVWTHVTCVYNGANKIIYLNGASNTTVASTLNPGVWTFPNLRVGLDDYDRGFYGNVDEVRLFGQALTASEVNSYYIGVAPPTGLTATPGFNSVTLNWTAVPNATSYVISQGTTNGGPYTPLGSVAGNVTTYVDTSVTYPTTYYYVVQAVVAPVTSQYSNQATCTPLLPPIWVSSTSLQTNESGASATFNLQINAPLTAGNSVTFAITSSNGNEGRVYSSGQPPAPATSAASIAFTVNGPQSAGTTIPVTVVGIDDPFVDGNQPYTVTVTFGSTQPVPFSGFTVPVINCVNNDNDIPGVTINRPSGLVTSENLTSDTFAVVLNTQPTANVTMSLASSNPLEGTVLPATLTFTTTAGQAYSAATGIGGWNVSHVVTVTGVDDPALDFTVPYSIVTGALVSTDPSYNTMVVTDVACSNLDNEVPPELTPVWGNSGCGLIGLEGLIALLALRRLRRKA